ncbi:MAG: MBL fold metallo-hydrolase [Planctomycetota bacterium]
MASVKIISIGAMAANPDWGEKEPVRTGHATTTLIETDSKRILIDPGLPSSIIAARLSERADMAPADITHVFLTSFHPEARRGIEAFDGADWLISEAEREAIGVPMAQSFKLAVERGHEEQAEALKEDIAVLQRFEPAEDSLDDGVDLFPLPGVTPGLCGLLVSTGTYTTLVCGDAIPTAYTLENGTVHRGALDIEQARESFKEAIEIADVLVLGRDNLVVNPVRGPF